MEKCEEADSGYVKDMGCEKFAMFDRKRRFFSELYEIWISIPCNNKFLPHFTQIDHRLGE